MRIGALVSVLSKKLADAEVVFVDALDIAAPKTAEAKNVVDALAKIKGHEIFDTKKHNVALFVLHEKDANIAKSFSNFGNIKVTSATDLNTLDALKYARVVLVNPQESVKIIEGRLAAGKSEKK
jgi:large subunit ribosomal protein L4